MWRDVETLVCIDMFPKFTITVWYVILNRPLLFEAPQFDALHYEDTFIEQRLEKYGQYTFLLSKVVVYGATHSE